MKKHRGVEALAYFFLGGLLFCVGAYLVFVNVLANAYGLIGGLSAGAEGIVWSDWRPELIGASQGAFGVGAAMVVGVMVFVIQMLVWHGKIELANATGAQKLLIYTAFIYDFTTTTWALSGGSFFSGVDLLASLLRLAMILGVAVLVFTIGAERSVVWGLQMMVGSWDGVVETLLSAGRPKGGQFQSGYTPIKDFRSNGGQKPQNHNQPNQQPKTSQERYLEARREGDRR